MWFDAEANFGRFNQKDSIDFYLEKIKSLGFTHAVVDVRPITGEVLFESAYAPKMEEWNGAKAGDFDYLGHFIEMDTSWDWRFTPHSTCSAPGTTTSTAD